MIFSCFYRLWSSTRLSSPAARDWLSNWWPPEAIGGQKGKEAIQALGPLLANADNDEYLVSLDYSKAFDHVDPRVADVIFRKFGLPPNLACILCQLWSHQLRFLQYDGQIMREPIRVSKSLPQGDAWSLIAMAAVLTPAMWQLRVEHPSATMRTFVDDRTWTAKTAHEALQVLRFWETWSLTLGLQEYNAKSQFYHRTVAGRTHFLELGVLTWP